MSLDKPLFANQYMLNRAQNDGNAGLSVHPQFAYC